MRAVFFCVGVGAYCAIRRPSFVALTRFESISGGGGAGYENELWPAEGVADGIFNRTASALLHDDRTVRVRPPPPPSQLEPFEKRQCFGTNNA